jgi:hypothetical protein
MNDDDTDFYAWTQAQALRQKDVAALDLDHLAEEIIDLGSNHRYAIESQLERLLLHLPKWRYDPAQDPRRLWRLTIRQARREIGTRVADSPSLQDHLVHDLITAYRHAHEDAVDETGLPVATVPEACPWSIAQGLDDELLPEET